MLPSSLFCTNDAVSCLPSAVIKMEGGTDHDLRILDMPPEEEVNREKSATVSGEAESPKKEDLKTLAGDRKPSVEKDKTEKVCIVFFCYLVGKVSEMYS